MDSRIKNPSLLQDLIAKLPYNLRMEWGALKRYNPGVHLSDFGNWLLEKAQDASEVTTIEPKTKTEFEKKGESKSKGKSDNQPGFLNFHATADDTNKHKGSNSSNNKNTGKNSNSSNGSCLICNGNQCKKVSECSKFKNLSQKER